MHVFEKPGEENTKVTLDLTGERGRELGVKTVLVATTRGETALKATEILGGFRIVAVTHSAGFKKRDYQEMPDDVRRELEKSGAEVLTSMHAFGAIGRAVRRKFKTYEVEEIVANVLRRFGEGTKVALEIALMAADAGLIRTDKDVISIGGTVSGADTAVVLRPANAHDFFDLKVREFICKPFDF